MAEEALTTTTAFAWLLPHVAETIARMVPSAASFTAFVHAVPSSCWTPAIAAFVALQWAPPKGLHAHWPTLFLRDASLLSSSALTLVIKTLPLQPSIVVAFPLTNAKDVASLVRSVGSCISAVHLEFQNGAWAPGEGQGACHLLLSCSALRQLQVSVSKDVIDNDTELDALLGTVLHPFVTVLDLSLRSTRVTPRLGWYLVQWLSAAPCTRLSLHNIPRLDPDAIPSLCNALESATALRVLCVVGVEDLAASAFHGWRLPPSLRQFAWTMKEPWGPETLSRLATTLEHAALERLSINGLEQLMAVPALRPMFSRIQLLNSENILGREEMFFDALGRMQSLETLAFPRSHIAADALRNLFPVLGMLQRLRTLDLHQNQFRRRELAIVLWGAMQHPHLTELHLSSHRGTFADLHALVPDIVACGRRLRRLSLEPKSREKAVQGSKTLLVALAGTPNPPFVVQQATWYRHEALIHSLGLGRDAKKPHQCILSF